MYVLVTPPTNGVTKVNNITMKKALFLLSILPVQRAKKVVSDSPGLVDFAIGPVNSVINLPDGQMKVFEKLKLQKNCEINVLMKTFLGLVEMMFGLVNVSFSLPDWQAVKMTVFAPCNFLLYCFENSPTVLKQ